MNDFLKKDRKENRANKESKAAIRHDGRGNYRERLKLLGCSPAVPSSIAYASFFHARGVPTSIPSAGRHTAGSPENVFFFFKK